MHLYFNPFLKIYLIICNQKNAYSIRYSAQSFIKGYGCLRMHIYCIWKSLGMFDCNDCSILVLLTPNWVLGVTGFVALQCHRHSRLCAWLPWWQHRTKYLTSSAICGTRRCMCAADDNSTSFPSSGSRSMVHGCWGYMIEWGLRTIANNLHRTVPGGFQQVAHWPSQVDKQKPTGWGRSASSGGKRRVEERRGGIRWMSNPRCFIQGHKSFYSQV